MTTCRPAHRKTCQHKELPECRHSPSVATPQSRGVARACLCSHDILPGCKTAHAPSCPRALVPACTHARRSACRWMDRPFRCETERRSRAEQRADARRRFGRRAARPIGFPAYTSRRMQIVCGAGSCSAGDRQPGRTLTSVKASRVNGQTTWRGTPTRLHDDMPSCREVGMPTCLYDGRCHLSGGWPVGAAQSHSPSGRHVGWPGGIASEPDGRLKRCHRAKPSSRSE